MSIFDYAYQLAAELIKLRSELAGRDDFDGTPCPLVNGEYIWNTIPNPDVGQEILDHYKEAFDKLTWETKFIVTSPGYWEEEVSRGKHLGSVWVPDKGYDAVCPVLDDWTLPVKPGEAISQEKSWECLTYALKEHYCQELKAQAKEKAWADWVKLAEAELGIS